MAKTDETLELIRRVLQIEAEEMLSVKRELDFRAVAVLEHYLAVPENGRVITTGMGKSGLVARRLSVMLNGIGRPSQFLHPCDALHGDMGMVRPGDVLFCVSRSGETEELLRLVERFKAGNYPIASLIGSATSRLGFESSACIPYQVGREAYGLADIPTTSSVVAMAICDALVAVLAFKDGFTAENYRNLHPAGKESDEGS